MTNWLRKNISFILSAIALLTILTGFISGIIPKYATAADLDKVADILQTKIEHDIKQDTQHKIEHLQNEISAVKIPFMVSGQPINQQAQFYIDQKEQEIQRIKESE